MPAAIKHFDKDGSTQISGKVWADAFAGQAQTAQKFTIENVGDRVFGASLAATIEQVGSNDGNGELRIGADTATLSKPYTVAAALTGAGAGGVWGSTGLKYYRITATNATGETIGSTEISINVDVTTKKVVLTWAQISGGTGYKIYRSIVSGTYTPTAFVATVSGAATTTYTDDGSGPSAGTLPSQNTTGGAAPDYGTVPALATTPLAIGALAIGQQWFYWVNRVVSTGVSEIGNPRQANVRFAE